MTSVSITSWKPACMSLIVEENDGGGASVFSAADPSALIRILEAVSLLGVLPSRCHSAPLETDPGQLVVDFQIAGLPLERAQLLAKRLERVITVTQVLHSEKRCATA